MIVVFCSALTQEAPRLTMGAYVCRIMMNLLPQVSQKARWMGLTNILEMERNGLSCFS